MRNRQFVFAPKIEYQLVAESANRADKLRGANQNSLTFPTWFSILELVRTHFAPWQARGEEAPLLTPPKPEGEGGRKFGKAAACTEQSRSEPHRSKPQKNPKKKIGSPARLWREL